MNLSRFLEVTRSGGTMEAALESHLVWKGGGKDKSETTTTSKPMQTPQYQNLLKESDSWLNSGGFDQNYGGSADFDPVANMTQGQTDAIGSMSQTGSALQQLYNSQGQSSLGNFLGSYDPQKTGLNDAIAASNNQMDWNYQTAVAPQVRQGATGAGQFGSSRHGIAEGLALSQLSQQKMNNASQLAYQDQQAYNQNQLAALNNLSAISKGLSSGAGLSYDAEALQQNQDQREIAGQLEKWAYENNVDLNNLLAYKQLISGDMGGKVTSQTEGSSGGSGFGGMLSSVGGQFAGSYAGSLGQGMGSRGAGILG